MPGPPSGSENYVICLSFSGPLSSQDITKINAAIKNCLKKEFKKIKVVGTVAEQRIAPKR
ncbi:MAG TPA: hypothetical protein VGR82_12005 [Methylomirabilota bacterium]|jgi:hypothetical protein|nr:hypothetical protein [Methylomirabilota bacterium]